MGWVHRLKHVFLAPVLVLGLVLGAGAGSGPCLAGGPELELLLRSSAGRFLVAELAAPDAARLARWIESSGLEQELLRSREALLAESPRHRRMFEAAPPAPIDLAQEAALRKAFLSGESRLFRSYLEFVTPGSEPLGGFASLKRRFLDAVRGSPSGGVYPIEGSRRDLLGGFVHRIRFSRRSWDPRALFKNPAFESGYIDDALELFPDLYGPLGFRRVTAEGKTWIEIPDAEALNARRRAMARFTGAPDPFDGGMAFEPQLTGEVPLITYAELVANGIMPVGAGGQYIKHDLIVHGMALVRMLPGEVFSAVSARFRFFLRVYRDPRLASCDSCRKALREGLEGWIQDLDQASGLVIAGAVDRRRGVEDALASIERKAHSGYRTLLSGDGQSFAQDFLGSFPRRAGRQGYQALGDSEADLIRDVVQAHLDREPSRVMFTEPVQANARAKELARALREHLEPFARR